ncbi:unnamed protein product, partial [Ixodes pacificus]
PQDAITFINLGFGCPHTSIGETVQNTLQHASHLQVCFNKYDAIVLIPNVEWKRHYLGLGEVTPGRNLCSTRKFVQVSHVRCLGHRLSHT